MISQIIVKSNIFDKIQQLYMSIDTINKSLSDETVKYFALLAVNYGEPIRITFTFVTKYNMQAVHTSLLLQIDFNGVETKLDSL